MLAIIISFFHASVEFLAVVALLAVVVSRSIVGPGVIDLTALAEPPVVVSLFVVGPGVLDLPAFTIPASKVDNPSVEGPGVVDLGGFPDGGRSKAVASLIGNATPSSLPELVSVLFADVR